MHNNTGNAIIWIVIIIIILLLIFWLFAGFSTATTNQARNFGINLSGNQEVPPVVGTGAVGNGTATLSGNRQQLTYDITVQNLSSEIVGAHFHQGARGQNGPIVKNLNIESLGNNSYRLRGTWNSNDSNQPLTSNLVNDLLNSNIYVNVHSEFYPDGEIRGQVVPLLTN